MKAMVLKEIADLKKNRSPLSLENLPAPKPKDREILLAVSACGVCHTELDEIEGRTPPTVFPMILGHQVVGTVIEIGNGCSRYRVGDRVGVAWIHSACGVCDACVSGNENLCDDFKATGRDVNGGYAEQMTVLEDFAYRIPDMFSDSQAAPLLCAGAIGYRSLRLSNIKNGNKLGLSGFGASAHLVLKLVRHLYPKTDVFVFARKDKERRFAMELGVVWAGDFTETPPAKMEAIIDTTPAWNPVVTSLKHLASGGRLVINAIRKEEGDKDRLLKLDYPNHLWMEKEIKSVANVARKDVEGFLKLAAEIPIQPHVQEFPLKMANKALMELKEGNIRGGKVLKIKD